MFTAGHEMHFKFFSIKFVLEYIKKHRPNFLWVKNLSSPLLLETFMNESFRYVSTGKQEMRLELKTCFPVA